MKELADLIDVGQRCMIQNLTVNNNVAQLNGLLGEVKYVGKIPEIGQGYFVGVELDEPKGHGNGIMKGVMYWECEENKGLFLRPDKIKVGNYPKPSGDKGSSDEDIDEI